jgi:hypothetical protein
MEAVGNLTNSQFPILIRETRVGPHLSLGWELGIENWSDLTVQFLVRLRVLSGRFLPAEVLLHAIQHQSFPFALFRP